MSIKTGKSTRVEDLREGDHVTLVCNDDDTITVSGIVRTAVGGRYLDVPGSPFCLWLGEWVADWHVAVATGSA